MAGALNTAMVFDTSSTFRVARECADCHEANPLVAPFLRRGQVVTYAAGEAFDIGVMGLASKMKDSSHVWVRRTWWSCPPPSSSATASPPDTTARCSDSEETGSLDDRRDPVSFSSLLRHFDQPRVDLREQTVRHVVVQVAAAEALEDVVLFGDQQVPARAPAARRP